MVELVLIAKSAVLRDGEVADVAVEIAGGLITAVAKAAEYTPPEGVTLLKTDLVRLPNVLCAILTVPSCHVRS